MKKILTLLLLALVLAGAFSACSSNNVITAGLKIELTGLQRAGDGSVQVTWRVENPNVFSYVLHRTVQKISLNGTVIGTITDEAPLGVPAQHQAERTGVLAPAKSVPGTVIDQAVAQGSAAYQMDSQLTVLLLDDKFEKIALTSSGTVPVTAK